MTNAEIDVYEQPERDRICRKHGFPPEGQETRRPIEVITIDDSEDEEMPNGGWHEEANDDWREDGGWINRGW